MASTYQAPSRKRKRFFFELHQTKLQIRPISPARSCKKAYTVFADIYKAVLDWVPGLQQPCAPDPVKLLDFAPRLTDTADECGHSRDDASEAAVEFDLPQATARAKSSMHQRTTAAQTKKQVTFQLPEDHSDKRERDSSSWKPPWFRVSSPAKPADALGTSHNVGRTPKKHPKRRRSWPTSPGLGVDTMAPMSMPPDGPKQNTKEDGLSKLDRANHLLRGSTPAVKPRRQLRFTRAREVNPSPQGKLRVEHLSASDNSDKPLREIDGKLEECEDVYTKAYLSCQLSQACMAGEPWAQMSLQGQQMDPALCHKADNDFNEAHELVLQQYPAARLEGLKCTVKSKWTALKAKRIQAFMGSAGSTQASRAPGALPAGGTSH